MYRIAALFVVCCFAFGGWSCASKSKSDYEEVLMPLQTGSVLHRRVEVKATEEKKQKTKPKKKPAAAPKPEEKPSATPAPEEESTPPPDRFR